MIFHHHPDGRIFLRDEDGALLYAATLDEFLDDIAALGLPPYDGLPEGYRERRWEPGRHVLLTADSQDAGPDDWSAQAYLDAVEALAERAAARAQGETPPPGPDEVPREVTMFQARAVMRQRFLASGSSLLAAVDAYLRSAVEAAAELPEDDPARVQAELHLLAWEYATVVQRDSPLVAAMAAHFGLGEEAIDDLFRQAAEVAA